MKYRFFSHLLFVMMMSAVLFSSCKKDDPDPVVIPPSAYSNGVFICNEGPFMNGTGTLTFRDNTTGKVTQDLYKTVNHESLGNIVQSMEVFNDYGYVMVNNANKIVVVNILNMKKVTTISPVTLPRFLVPVDDRKAYVSCWDNTVAVVNLLTNTVEKNVAVGTGPERMAITANRAFILNQGGFGLDSTVSVISTQNDQLVGTIAVYPKPSGAVVDKNGMLWVLCSGKGFNGWPASDDSEGHLLQIDPVTLSITRDILFPGRHVHPDKLVINKAGDVMYFLYKDGIYSMSVNDNSLPSQPLVSRPGYLYALGLDVWSNTLYISDPLDFTQDGMIFRYNGITGMPVDSFRAGIIPTYFCFQP